MFLKHLKIKLLLILLEGWLVQSQISLSLHDFNIDQINDLFYGRLPKQESQEVNNVQCESDKCSINAIAKTDLLLQRGNQRIIELTNSKLKQPIKIEITVAEATTVMNYDIKYLSPYYDVLYGMSKDAETLKDSSNLHHSQQDHTYVFSKQFPNTDLFRKYSETKEITEVSEKFKCGSFISAKKLTQVVALAPRPNEGIIVFTPGTLSYFKLKICIREQTIGTLSKCVSTTINAGESIYLPGIEGFDDKLSIKIVDIKTPRTPVNPQDILAEYTFNNKSNTLSFSNLHVGLSPAVGSLNRDSIAALQTSNVITDTFLGDYKSFEPKSLMSWNLLAKSTSNIPWTLEERIRNFLKDVSNEYTEDILLIEIVSIINSGIDNRYYAGSHYNDHIKINNDYLKIDNLLLSIGADKEKNKYFRSEEAVNELTETEQLINKVARDNEEVNIEDLKLYNNSIFMFCDEGPTLVENLKNCISMDQSLNDSNTECAHSFIDNITSISKENKYLAAYFGVFNILDKDFLNSIENNLEEYCLDEVKYSIDRYMKATLVGDDEKLRAFWIPVILIVSAIITALTAVAVTEWVASTKKCKAQEVNIPVEQQKRQIDNYPMFSTMYAGILKEFPSNVNVQNNRPLGVNLNLTNYEDQTVKLEISAFGYSVDFSYLKSKIQDYRVNICKFYLNKALSTCEIIFNNVGDTAELSIKIKGQNVLSVSKKVIANVGINRHTLQLSTPDIIDKNIQICLVAEEEHCSKPEDISIIENPEITGDDLVPKGGQIGVGGSFSDFWNLININISFAAFIWIMWIVGVICIIVFLLLLFSFFKWMCNSTRLFKRRRHIYDSDNSSHLNYIALFTIIFSNNFLTMSNCITFSIHETLNSPKAYHLTAWDKFRNSVFRFRPSQDSFELKGFEGLFPPLYEFIERTDMIGIIQEQNISNVLMQTDEPANEIDVTAYNSDGLGTIYDGKRKYTIINNYKPPFGPYNQDKILKIFNINNAEVTTQSIANLLSQNISLNNFRTQVQLYSYYPLEWSHKKDVFKQFKSTKNPKIVNNVGFMPYLNTPCDKSPMEIYYRNNGKYVCYSFVCIDHYISTGYWSLKNYTFLIKIPSPDNYLFSIQLLNKAFVNHIKQPVIMIITSDAVQRNLDVVYSWLAEKTGTNLWTLTDGAMFSGFSKIAMLWCDNCVVKLNNQQYKVQTGSIEPNNNFCLLPNGKISGAEFGEGPRVKCVCGYSDCYCFNLNVKLFAYLKIKGIHHETWTEGGKFTMRSAEFSVKCFVGDGGEIQLNSQGDFVAHGGPIQITSDYWDNIDVVEPGHIIKAPVNRKVTHDIVEIKTIGAKNQTFMTIQSAGDAKLSTFKNTWDKMNEDYPYVIPITIAVPCTLFLLIVVSCCYRYCRGGRKMMKLISYPVTKTTDIISRNFKQNNSTMNNENTYRSNNEDLNNNSLPNSLRVRQRGRRPIM